MDKLKMHSPDLTERNIERLAELFPNVITESRDAEGRVVRAVDFDLLRQELSDHVVEGPRERYGLDWPGKREALFTANAPIAKTLRPVREESVDFDTTQNLFIEGDNLDALKLLQESYLGKVKLIYIDPPYNTGNDFLYSDDFSQTSAEFLEKSGQVDDEGNRLVANTESNGRFHSDWLSMMYPRLKLARNLLREDGVIAISIDDSEGANLNRLGREIFGDANFVAQVVWKHTEQSKNDEPYFSRHHNYVAIFRRGKALPPFRLPRSDSDNKAYANPDNDPRGLWRAGDVRSPSPRPSLRYTVSTPSGGSIEAPQNGWRWKQESMQGKIDSGEIVFRDDDTRLVRKIYLADQGGRTPETVWLGSDAGTTRQANAEIKELFDVGLFDTPKPTRLVRRLLELVDDPNAIVFDFFAGSGTTGHAVLAQNAGDGGSRRFVLIQLDEPCEPDSLAHSANFGTLADVAIERLRRAGNAVGRSESVGKIDIGFRVLRIDSTNLQGTDLSPDQQRQDSLLDAVESIKPDRTSEDLVFQVLLDWGLELSVPIARENLAGHEVFDVDGGALLACFDETVSLAAVEAMARREPLRAVFRASGFATDADRINTEQLFAQYSPATDVKAI